MDDRNGKWMNKCGINKKTQLIPKTDVKFQINNENEHGNHGVFSVMDVEKVLMPMNRKDQERINRLD